MVISALLAAAALSTASPQAAPPAPSPRLEFPANDGIPDVPVENPHDYRGKPYCKWCHAGRDGKLVAEPIKVCTQCHPVSIMKHPTGIVAKPVPAALPLGAGDKIVCHTCHDPHDLKARRKGLRLELTALCQQCHAAHGNGKGAAPRSVVPPPSHRQTPSGH